MNLTLVIVVFAVWLALCLVALAVCAAAARGDGGCGCRACRRRAAARDGALGSSTCSGSQNRQRADAGRAGRRVAVLRRDGQGSLGNKAPR